MQNTPTHKLLSNVVGSYITMHSVIFPYKNISYEFAKTTLSNDMDRVANQFRIGAKLCRKIGCNKNNGSQSGPLVGQARALPSMGHVADLSSGKPEAYLKKINKPVNFIVR